MLLDVSLIAVYNTFIKTINHPKTMPQMSNLPDIEEEYKLRPSDIPKIQEILGFQGSKKSYDYQKKHARNVIDAFRKVWSNLSSLK